MFPKFYLPPFLETLAQSPVPPRGSGGTSYDGSHEPPWKKNKKFENKEIRMIISVIVFVSNLH